MSGYVSQLFGLDGRVAIVTGASRGIGAALANGLAKAGARVVALARTGERAQVLVPQIEYVPCDVTADEGFAAVVADAFSRHRRVDILVNAAGISLPPSRETEVDRFAKTLEVNLSATYAACLVAADYMARGGGGSIINVTSINSAVGFPDNPGYVASKGGLRMLTKALAIDLAPRQVRVNALAPGYIRTAMTEGSYADPVRRQERLDRMIIRRWGEPEDLVGAAIYLASPASSYVTGADLFVDGGWTAKGL